MYASFRSLISVSVAAALAASALVGIPTVSAADQGLVGWGEFKLPNAEVGEITKIAAGYDFTIALRRNKTLVGWGADGRDGTPTGGHAATPPDGNDYTVIDAGTAHTLALKADKTIVAWGTSQYNVGRNPPAGLFIAIAAGDLANVAIREDGSSAGQGSLLHWGAGAAQFALPTGNDFIAVAAGVGHFLALRANGSIAAWGPIGLSQNEVPPGTFTAIAAGDRHCLALRSDRTIAAWGINSFGSLQATVPTAEVGTHFRAIAGGGSHSLAIRDDDGSILAWGHPDALFGTPVETGFVDIAAGGLHCVALRADGTATEWGKTGKGLTAPHIGVTQAVASRYHGLALMQDGSLVGWGSNSHNQASPPAGNSFKAVAVGDEHSIALRTDGTITVWGREIAGEPPPTEGGFIAIGAAGNYHVAIKAVSSLAGSLVFWGDDTSLISNVPPGNDFTAVAVGGGHGLALKSDGSIVGWGSDLNGQATSQPEPDFVAIAAGNKHSLALKRDGSLFGWGLNDLNQRTVPTATTYTAIAAGGNLSGAVTAAGTLVSWGSGGGAYGGTGTPPAGTGFTKISAGVTYFMALGGASGPLTPILAPIITYPLTGQVLEEGRLVATATIPGDRAQLIKAELLLNDTFWGVQNAPLSATVTFPPPPALPTGSYAVTVRVQANDGRTATSDPVLVHVPSPLDECFLVSFGELLPFVGVPSRVGDDGAHRTSGGGIVRSIAMSVLDLDLDLFRALRDDLLSTTPAGRYYTDVYNQMSLPLIQTVLANPSLITPIHAALVEWTPAIQALVDGQGGTMAITPAMAAQAQTILTNLRAVATGELAAMMDAETAALDPSTWSAMSIDGLLTRVESQTRPPPEITTHPAFQSVTGGSNVMFSVTTSGAGPDTYQWFRDGTAIAGATGATYLMPSAQRFHGGQYSVVVTNPFGSTTSNTAALAVSPAAPNDARLLNLSTRGLAQSQDSVLIPGFVIQGSGNKKLLIRAVGPSLADLGFSSPVIPNPRMTLKRLDPTLQPAAYVDVTTNDDWQTNANAADIITVAAQLFAFGLTQPQDAALLVDLQPGQYSVIADDKTGTSGIAIVELYDADAGTPVSRLINISNRGFVGVGDEVMIPGFVISAEGPQTVLVRVIGPQLSSFNVPGAMADPKLTIYAGSISLFENDNWSDHSDAAYTAQIGTQLSAFALDAGSKDAALVVTLQPGAYTVVGSSADGTGTGVVLVEVYVVP